MTTPLVAVLALIDAASPGNSLVVIGIGGHGGVGKSTLARAISDHLPSVQIIPTDSFWSGAQFDLPRLRVVLDGLLAGRSATYEEWDWTGGRLAGHRTVEPTGLVIIEGVCALHQMFRDDMSVRIWVEAPYDVRLARGIARDGEHMRSTWTDVWMPSEDAYVARDNPHACAQLTVDGTRPL